MLIAMARDVYKRQFYARGQTGQQLLLGAYSALSRQIGLGKVKMYTRHEMLDVVKVDGRARGIIARNLITGKIERFAAHAVVVATGGYVNTFFLSTNAMASNGSAAWPVSYTHLLIHTRIAVCHFIIQCFISLVFTTVCNRQTVLAKE